MQISAIDAFLAVCDSGSFREAAQRLYLTQPAISKRVATVENRLGVRLFDRVGRRVLLTEAGRSFLPHARRMRAAMEDAQRAIDNLADRVAGRLSLALSHHVAMHRMPPLLQTYVQRHPAVELDIHFLGSEDACHAVAQGHVEIAVVTLPEPPVPGLRQEPVWTDPMAIAVAADHALAKHPHPSVRDLTDVPALLPEADTQTYANVAGALAAHGIKPVVRQHSNNLDTLRMLAGVGLGWTALPLSMLADPVVALRLSDLPIVRRLGTVRHPERHLSSAAAALLTLLSA